MSYRPYRPADGLTRKQIFTGVSAAVAILVLAIGIGPWWLKACVAIYPAFIYTRPSKRDTVASLRRAYRSMRRRIARSCSWLSRLPKRVAKAVAKLFRSRSQQDDMMWWIVAEEDERRMRDQIK